MEQPQLPRVDRLVADRLLGPVPCEFGGLKEDRRQLPRAGGLVAGRLLGSESVPFASLNI